MQIINSTYLHLIMPIESGKPAILPEWQEIFLNYVKAHLTYHEQKTVAINAHRNHMHLLTQLNVDTSIDELVSMVKSASKVFAMQQKEPCSLCWSEEYICLSVGGAELEDVSRYIRRQHEIHLLKSLEQEIEDILDQTETDLPLRILNQFGYMIFPNDYSLN